MKAHLKQVYLMTEDRESTRSFYEKGLGLEIKRHGETSVSFHTGSCELKIQQDFPESSLEKFNLGVPGKKRGEGAIVVIVLDSERLEFVHQRLREYTKSNPGEVLTGPREVPWGDRMFLAKDPAGYCLEIRGNKEP